MKGVKKMDNGRIYVPYDENAEWSRNLKSTINTIQANIMRREREKRAKKHEA